MDSIALEKRRRQPSVFVRSFEQVSLSVALPPVSEHFPSGTWKENVSGRIVFEVLRRVSTWNCLSFFHLDQNLKQRVTVQNFFFRDRSSGDRWRWAGSRLLLDTSSSARTICLRTGSYYRSTLVVSSQCVPNFPTNFLCRVDNSWSKRFDAFRRRRSHWYWIDQHHHYPLRWHCSWPDRTAVTTDEVHATCHTVDIGWTTCRSRHEVSDRVDFWIQIDWRKTSSIATVFLCIDDKSRLSQKQTQLVQRDHRSRFRRWFHLFYSRHPYMNCYHLTHTYYLSSIERESVEISYTKDSCPTNLPLELLPLLPLPPRLPPLLPPPREPWAVTRTATIVTVNAKR